VKKIISWFFVVSLFFLTGISNSLLSDQASLKQIHINIAPKLWWKAIKINEIYYDVDSAHGTETDNEWIELYNASSVAINLKNWRIEDNSQTDLLTAEDFWVQPGEFVLISKTNSTWDYWGISLLIPPAGVKFLVLNSQIGNGLNNNGDRLVLKNSQNEIIDAVSWGTDNTILNPAISDVEEGHSIERNPKGKDTDVATDFIDQENPTPGAGL